MLQLTCRNALINLVREPWEKYMYTLKLQTADLPLVIKQATIMTLSKPYSLSLQLKLKRGNVLYSITVFVLLFICVFVYNDLEYNFFRRFNISWTYAFFKSKKFPLESRYFGRVKLFFLGLLKGTVASKLDGW